MGGEPWFYFVPYQADINRALQGLRKREFDAGRYNPVTPFPNFPAENAPAPGARHASIDAAIEAADADGTRSILDMARVADEPDYGAITPVPEEQLVELFGTKMPTRDMIESNDDLFEMIDRGQGVYVVAYEDEKPSEIFFAGYSFD